VIARRDAVFAAFGAACALLVWPWAHAFAVWIPLVGAVAGIAYGRMQAFDTDGPLDRMTTCAALAIPLWFALDVVAVPLANGQAPAWGVVAIRDTLSAWIGWTIAACALGIAGAFASRIAPATDTAANPRMASDAPAAKRVVIIGGGFAGMTAAMELERALGADRSIALTLVSSSNALLFTPMLAEVAGSSVEPTHISTPLRSSLRRTDVVRATVRAIDLADRRIDVGSDDGRAPGSIAYDHVVFALGSVSNFFGNDAVRENALEFKSLGDAIAIRNRAIAHVERADREPDAMRRQGLLTFVIAGAGFAGIELAGALNDFLRGIVIDYSNLQASDVRVIVVHARDRILPELSEPLATYAVERMRERGVAFRLATRVVAATPHDVSLDPTETIESETLIWTAGTAPHPLLASLALACDRRGAVVVDRTLAVAGNPGIWALGDCATIPTGDGETTYPPTAQHALREAKTLAHNLVASTRDEPLKPFVFRSLGSLCVIGHQLACAEIREPITGRTLRFSGVFAWMLWRAIYLSKLPGTDRKVRVLVDWIVELFFPRDTVQTIEIA